MAWMIPIVATNRRRGRSGLGAVIAGLVMFLVFGVMFFIFFNRSGIIGFDFPIIFIIFGFIVFLLVIFGISMAASSMSKTYKPLKSDNFEQIQTTEQTQTYQGNPYIAQRLNSENIIDHNQEDFTVLDPDIKEVHFCRYCGTKIERDARFCQECGSKL